jgi:hypothetical protein
MAWAAELTSRPGDQLYWLDTVDPSVARHLPTDSRDSSMQTSGYLTNRRTRGKAS